MKKKTIEDYLYEMNKEFGSNVTTRVIKDEMYQRNVLEFANEKGEGFFRCMEDLLNDNWEFEKVYEAKIRYKELYLN